MFISALMVGIVGSICIAIGKASNSAISQFVGGVTCFVSAILFLISAFSVF